MTMPKDIPIIDTMISFPTRDKKAQYKFITEMVDYMPSSSTVPTPRRPSSPSPATFNVWLISWTSIQMKISVASCRPTTTK